MATARHEWAPAAMRPLVEAAIARARSDERIIGLTVGGSAAVGSMDEFSDLDFVFVCRDEDHPEMLREGHSLAADIGPLLASFTGEHVGEPRLLIALYGSPARHVDLKFVAARDLDDRVEDGLVVWQRDGALTEALGRVKPQWPRVDRQWLEDRFWIWVHYGATKVGRGELFECLDMLAFMRKVVMGPLIAESRGRDAGGIRRIELIAPDLVPDLEATIGDHTARGCIDALSAAIHLYRRLRDTGPDIERRTGAESASVAYLAEVEASV